MVKQNFIRQEILGECIILQMKEGLVYETSDHCHRRQ